MIIQIIAMENTFVKNLANKIQHLDLAPKGAPNIDTSERVVSVLAGSFLLYKSLKNAIQHPILAAQGLAASGLLLYRGSTGVCPLYQKLNIDTTDPQAINISETIIVNAPRAMVYAFWRDLANLPKFMSHLKEVTELNEKESHWKAVTPGNLIDLAWNAEITHEEEGTYLGWQSTEGSMIENAGKVEFRDTLNNIGTEIHVEISYFPPVGSVGRGIASLFNGVFEKMILSDIQSFKTYTEQADFRRYAGLEPVV